ncbi:MAG: GGDEF domain-containing protein [Gammaproteobacteria bacterium]|nr:GGDEF domain-containing protein [Gammaproteobacteria bacterium]
MDKVKTGAKAGSAGETISRLQRGVLRLALSYHGQHPELDKLLKKLGLLIRGQSDRKNDELQSLIDEIVDTILSQGLAQGVAQDPGQDASRTLGELLGRLETRFPDARPFKSIQQRVSRPIEGASLERVLEDTVDAVAQIAAFNPGQGTAAEKPNTQGAGILARLLEEIDFPAAAGAAISEIRNRIRARHTEAEFNQHLVETAAVISAEFSAEGDPKQFAQARDQLLLLVELIPFPAGLTGRAKKTRRSIEMADTPAALYGCIPEIADLTAAMRVELQAEIDDLGEFLKNILSRLREFESQIRKSDTFRDRGAKNASTLEKNVCGEVEEMRSEIVGESDIAQIKIAVASHLDNINTKLGDFVQAEHKRCAEASEKVENMVNAIAELEDEAKELRDNLKEQREQVLIDPLTGILNRSGYTENVGKEFLRWRRYGSTLTLAVIDLDRFKDINDSYGHAAGDKVLTNVAQQIESQIRECDILCRYGGEEFVLLLPETSLQDGMALLEKLRAYIAKCNFHFQQTPVPVTLSCGIAEFRESDNVADVFDRADQAMYLSKRSGRDQCRSEDELREESE